MDPSSHSGLPKLAPGAPGEPTPFGDYLLFGLIARGGMAEVYRARAVSGPAASSDEASGMLAIKVMRPQLAREARFVDMFIREGRLAMLLSHEAIVRTHEVGQAEGRYYIAMEYLGGKDLTQVLRRCGETGQRIPVPHAVHIGACIAAGLDYAHTLCDAEGRPLHIVNRNVSPSNVRLGYDGRVKLLDFGIAQAMVKVSSEIGVLKGKFSYMSPEQIRGLPVDARTDVFSTGIILHEMLTTEKLFRGDSEFALMEKVRNAEVVPPSKFNRRVSPELDRIVMKALARDLPDRYPTAAALRADLLAVLGTYRFGEHELEELVRGMFRADHAREQEEIRACTLAAAHERSGEHYSEISDSALVVIESSVSSGRGAVPHAVTAGAVTARLRSDRPGLADDGQEATAPDSAMAGHSSASTSTSVSAPPPEPGSIWARIKNKLGR